LKLLNDVIILTATMLAAITLGNQFLTQLKNAHNAKLLGITVSDTARTMVLAALMLTYHRLDNQAIN